MKKNTSMALESLRSGASLAWLWRQWAGLLALLAVALSPNLSVQSGEIPSLTEYQVKALFLLNFTKYVEWPSTAFERADTPITIGVVGDNHFGEELKNTVEGKRVNGRKIIIQTIDNEGDWAKCRILFVSCSEKKHIGDIINKTKALPILTVGETDQFIRQGGIVNFSLKDGKVRLEVSLEAARLAKLEISSRLLSVADVVRGKP